MRLGVEDITVSRLDYAAETQTLAVTGENFTPFSVILKNGEQVPTEYISRNQLCAPELEAAEGDTFCVAQISATDSMRILSQTGELVFSDSAS